MARHPNIPKPMAYLDRGGFNPKSKPGATDKADAEKQRRRDVEALTKTQQTRPMRPPGKR